MALLPAHGRGVDVSTPFQYRQTDRNTQFNFNGNYLAQYRTAVGSVRNARAIPTWRLLHIPRQNSTASHGRRDGRDPQYCDGNRCSNCSRRNSREIFLAFRVKGISMSEWCSAVSETFFKRSLKTPKAGTLAGIELQRVLLKAVSLHPRRLSRSRTAKAAVPIRVNVSAGVSIHLCFQPGSCTALLPIGLSACPTAARLLLVWAILL